MWLKKDHVFIFWAGVFHSHLQCMALVVYFALFCSLTLDLVARQLDAYGRPAPSDLTLKKKFRMWHSTSSKVGNSKEKWRYLTNKSEDGRKWHTCGRSGLKTPSSLPDQECHLFLGIYFRRRKGQNFDLGFWNWSINPLFLRLSGSEDLRLVLASGSSMYGRSALLQLVAWVAATSCSWLPSGPGCWWLPCRQASDAQDWYWQQRWSRKDQQSRKLLSEWSPWKWTPQENWISLWKVCLLVLLK